VVLTQVVRRALAARVVAVLPLLGVVPEQQALLTLAAVVVLRQTAATAATAAQVSSLLATLALNEQRAARSPPRAATPSTRSRRRAPWCSIHMFQLSTSLSPVAAVVVQVALAAVVVLVACALVLLTTLKVTPQSLSRSVPVVQ
jgi:hypothetical protein